MEKNSSGYGFWEIIAGLGLTGWLFAILKYLWPMVRLEPIQKLPPDEHAWVKIYLGRMLGSLPASLASGFFFAAALVLLWKIQSWHWLRRFKWLAIFAVTALLIAVPPGVSLMHAFGVQLGLLGAIAPPSEKIIEFSPGLESAVIDCVATLGALACVTLGILMVLSWIIALTGKVASTDFRKIWMGHSLTHFGMAIVHTFLFAALAAVANETGRPDAAILGALAMLASILEFFGCLPEELNNVMPNSPTAWLIFIISAVAYTVVNLATTVILLSPYVEHGVELIFAW